MKNIILTGFMASGKTTVGTMLAKILGYRFCDTDEMIEKTGVRWSTAYKQPAIEGVIEKVLSMAAGIWEEA